jgi:two-component system, sensor histidine kinase
LDGTPPTPIENVAMKQFMWVGKAMVLVIDDDPAVAASTKLLLKLDGYRVQAAASIEAAIAVNKTTGTWADLIVADYRLANGRSGIDAIRTLRTLAQRLIPAVLVTGDTFWEAPKALETLDGCEVLSKPFDPNKFLAVVSQLASAKPAVG